MSGGPRPLCEAIISVNGWSILCELDRDHDGNHAFQGGYKLPTVTWPNHKWISMSAVTP